MDWTRVKHANTDRRTSSPRVIVVAAVGGDRTFILSSNHVKADIATHNHLAQQTFILWEIAPNSKHLTRVVHLQPRVVEDSLGLIP